MTNEQKQAAVEHFQVWTVNRAVEFENEIPEFAKYHAEENGVDPDETERALKHHVWLIKHERLHGRFLKMRTPIGK